MPSGDRRFGQLLKLHGSISWLRCPKCPGLRFVIPDLSIYRDRVPDAFVDSRSLDKPEIPCRECGSPVGSCIVAPTQRKTYDIPALNEVWSEAERVLKRAGRVYFIGYSLPEDDVEIALLLRRSLDRVEPARITVVEWDEQRRSATTIPLASDTPRCSARSAGFPAGSRPGSTTRANPMGGARSAERGRYFAGKPVRLELGILAPNPGFGNLARHPTSDLR